MTRTVGFDVCMTLVDTRDAMRLSFERVATETGTAIDARAAVDRVGESLAAEMSRWFSDGQVESAVARYRAVYAELAVVASTAMPGAHSAVRAVHDAGWRVAAITSMSGRVARATLRSLEIPVDEVHGDVYGDAKAEVMRRAGVVAYVGDHVSDMRAAALAGSFGVAVATGACDPVALRRAGAGHLIDSLLGLPNALPVIGDG